MGVDSPLNLRTNRMSDRVFGLKKDSQAYELVLQALEIADSESLSEAHQFLREQVCELELKYWECLAISDCFEKCIRA